LEYPSRLGLSPLFRENPMKRSMYAEEISYYLGRAAEVHGKCCRPPPEEWEPPLIIFPEFDPEDVIAASGRPYEPSEFEPEEVEEEYDPIMVRSLRLHDPKIAGFGGYT
jgi:hypothetical protein